MPYRLPLLSLFGLLLFPLAGCGSSDANCRDACENLATCDKLSGSESDCRESCRADPSVLEADLRCFAQSGCAEIDSCIPSGVHPVSCWSMCSRIYEECGSQIETREAGKLSQPQCLAYCRETLPQETVSCVRNAACERMASCF